MVDFDIHPGRIVSLIHDLNNAVVGFSFDIRRYPFSYPGFNCGIFLMYIVSVRSDVLIRRPSG